MKFRFAAAALVAAFAGTASAEPLLVKYAFPGAPQALMYPQAMVPWAEQVTKESDGTIEVRLYPGMTLANPQNVYDRVLNGVAEMAYMLVGMFPDQFRKSTVAMMPYESRNPQEAALANWRLYEKGVFGDEFAKFKVLALPVFTNMTVHSKKPIRTMADFKGVKVASMSRTMSEVVEKLGGTPITMPPADFYASMQRGVVDAVGIGWPGVAPFKLTEVTQYHLMASFTGEGAHQLMSRDAYNKLPAKGKAAIDKLSGLHYSKMYADAIAAMDQQGIGIVKAANQAIIEPTPEEEARWLAHSRAVIDEWIAKTPDGLGVLAAYRAEIANIRAGR
jgi:TRAP-type C4-dicarboxylate transport system substrate-binding protein